jgi:hypothetical protein
MQVPVKTPLNSGYKFCGMGLLTQAHKTLLQVESPIYYLVKIWSSGHGCT